MKRISEEDGLNAGFRNIGRFYLALIPWALAVGALAWMGTWVAFHEWQRETRQEKRAAIYVAAPEPVKSKIKITVLKRSCVKVERADLDGRSLIIYAAAPSGCDSISGLGYAEWHWQEVSPDGTVLHADYSNEMNIHSGEKVEFKFTIPSDDDRVAEVRVWISR